MEAIYQNNKRSNKEKVIDAFNSLLVLGSLGFGIAESVKDGEQVKIIKDIKKSIKDKTLFNKSANTIIKERIYANAAPTVHDLSTSNSAAFNATKFIDKRLQPNEELNKYIEERGIIEKNLYENSKSSKLIQELIEEAETLFNSGEISQEEYNTVIEMSKSKFTNGTSPIKTIIQDLRKQNIVGTIQELESSGRYGPEAIDITKGILLESIKELETKKTSVESLYLNTMTGLKTNGKFKTLMEVNELLQKISRSVLRPKDIIDVADTIPLRTDNLLKMYLSSTSNASSKEKDLGRIYRFTKGKVSESLSSLQSLLKKSTINSLARISSGGKYNATSIKRIAGEDKKTFTDLFLLKENDNSNFFAIELQETHSKGIFNNPILNGKSQLSSVERLYLTNKDNILSIGDSLYAARNIAIDNGKGGIKYISYNDYAANGFVDAYSKSLEKVGNDTFLNKKKFRTFLEELDQRLSKARVYIAHKPAPNIIDYREIIPNSAKLIGKSYIDIEGNLSEQIVQSAFSSGNPSVVAATPTAFNKGVFYTPNSQVGNLTLDTVVNSNSQKIFRSDMYFIKNEKKGRILKPSFMIEGDKEIQSGLFGQRIANLSEESAKKFNQVAAEITHDIQLKGYRVTGSILEDQIIANRKILGSLRIVSPFSSEELSFVPNNAKEGDLLRAGTKLFTKKGSAITLGHNVVISNIWELENGSVVVNGMGFIPAFSPGTKLMGEHGIKSLVVGSGGDNAIHASLGLSTNKELFEKWNKIKGSKDAAEKLKVINDAITFSKNKFGAFVTSVGMDIVKRDQRGASLSIQLLIDEYSKEMKKANILENYSTKRAIRIKNILKKTGISVSVEDIPRSGTSFRKQLENHLLDLQVKVKLPKEFNAFNALHKIKDIDMVKEIIGQQTDKTIKLRTAVMNNLPLYGQRATINQDTHLILRMFGADELMHSLKEEALIKDSEIKVFKHMFDISKDVFKKEHAIRIEDIPKDTIKQVFNNLTQNVGGGKEVESNIRETIEARKKLIEIAKKMGKDSVIYVKEADALIPINTLNPNFLSSIISKSINSRFANPEAQMKVVNEILPDIEKSIKSIGKIFLSDSATMDSKTKANLFLKERKRLYGLYKDVFVGDNNVFKQMLTSKPTLSLGTVAHGISEHTLTGAGLKDAFDYEKNVILHPETFDRLYGGMKSRPTRELLIGRFPEGGIGNLQVVTAKRATAEQARLLGLEKNATYFIHKDNGAGSLRYQFLQIGDLDGDISQSVAVKIENEVHAALFKEKLNVMSDVTIDMINSISKGLKTNEFEEKLLGDSKEVIDQMISSKIAEKSFTGPITNIANLFKVSSIQNEEVTLGIKDLISVHLMHILTETAIKGKKNVASTEAIIESMGTLRQLFKEKASTKYTPASIEHFNSEYKTALTNFVDSLLAPGGNKEALRNLHSSIIKSTEEIIEKLNNSNYEHLFSKNEVEDLIDFLKKLKNDKEKSLTPIIDLLAEKISKATPHTIDAARQMHKVETEGFAPLYDMAFKYVEDNKPVTENITGISEKLAKTIESSGTKKGFVDLLKTFKPIKKYATLAIAGALSANILFRDRHTSEESFKLPNAAKGAEEIDPELMNSAQQIHIGAADFEEQLEAKLNAPVGVDFIKREVTTSLKGTDSIVYIKDLRKKDKYMY